MEELIEAGESAIDTIKLAISELEGFKKFEKIINYLEDDITEIENIIDSYKEIQEEQWEAEKECELSQYYRDTF